MPLQHVPRAALASLLGEAAVLDDGAIRREFAADLFGTGTLPELVLRPSRAADVAPALALLAGAGIACAVRGAGLSYTSGALPQVARWVAFDLRSLDRVLEVNSRDGWVRVEAGCSWRALDATLAPLGLRVPFWGPASGFSATIGGALSQDAVFFGSGMHGTIAGSVLSLSVATADGRVLRTGSDAIASHASPFMRGFGPDTTGLFIGDCGALGIKLEATLRVMPRPTAMRSSAFRFPTFGEAAAAMAALGARQLASECLLMGSSSQAAPQHLLDLIVEAHDDEQVGMLHQRALQSCMANGGERVGDGSLVGWRQAAFTDLASLATDPQRRWVPVHALVPHSRLEAAALAVDRVLQPATQQLASLELAWHWVALLVGPGAVLIEPNLSWRQGGDAGAAPDASIVALRAALAQALDDIGGVHLQVGRYYPYSTRLQAPALELLQAVKRQLDPSGITNPGVLGLR